MTSTIQFKDSRISNVVRRDVVSLGVLHRGQGRYEVTAGVNGVVSFEPAPSTSAMCK